MEIEKISDLDAILKTAKICYQDGLFEDAKFLVDLSSAKALISIASSLEKMAAPQMTSVFTGTAPGEIKFNWNIVSKE